MPLSPPAAREKQHTRTVTVEGYRRDDGLFDIEGRLVDTKTYGFPNQDRGRIEAGEPLHGMELRLTIDGDMLIHAAEAVTDYGPFAICRDINPAFHRLAGLRIGPGFRKQVREAFGGVHGCTHLVELLLGPMATTAFQTLYAERERQGRSGAAPAPGERPRIIDTCHALASDSPVVQRQWPEWYTGD
ncbi:DUF2889 domain-containing protein [Caenispirillum bisanense]|uniref:DUF2889 domain-containing protein n=1 Tax=Caenispirillum bisanense TaxID=414052 RepID=A0A286GN42_9PROT|nr:DUF2889 domain-containing protein [Caenispirillum bisanense]SOD96499.1 Protein of unknown function [Caenispirillum bisanense]